MSVLIKGADMPSGCAMCLLNNDSRCRAISLCDYDESNGSERRADCPLVEVPTPHGRLIDADKLNADIIRELVSAATLSSAVIACAIIDKSPTVIDAEADNGEK